MSTEIVALIGILVLVALILLRMWVGSAMAVVGFFGVLVMRGFLPASVAISEAPFVNLNSYVITVIPMFTLMGMIIGETNIGKNLFKAAYAWVGAIRGGLASATVMACGMLGAITGTNLVSSVIMSKIAMPEMRRYNYDDKLAASSIAAGAPLTAIIPPSMSFILYGVVTEQPIGQLFMAGIIPGVLMVLAFCLCIFIICTKNPALGPKGERTSAREKIRSLTGVIPTLVLFVIVLGGIYAGVVTITESGAIGALGAVIIALVTKQMTLKKFIKIVKDTVLITAMVIGLLVGVYIFIYLMSLSRLPFFVADLIISLNASPGVILAAVGLMYLVLGTFMPEIPLLLLTIPVLFPGLTAIGINPLHLGVVIVMFQTIGAISPPIGIVTFLISGFTGVPVPMIFRGVMPFIVTSLILIILVMLFPIIATWLPSLM